MKTPGANFATVWEMGLALPGAEKSSYFGQPALDVKGEMFAVRAAPRNAEPNTLSVPVGYTKRDRLIAANPDVYYLKGHYEPYPVVLVRLRKIDRDALRSLLRAAHRAVSSGRVKPMRPRPRAAGASRRRATANDHGRSATSGTA